MDILSFILGYNQGKAQGGGGSSSPETDIFPLQTVSGFLEDTADFVGCSLKTLSESFVIKEGETYGVEWDGTTYTCKGISAALNDLNYVYLGNGSGLGYEGNNEPFAIIYIVEYDMVQIIALNDTNESHEIRIYQQNSNIEIKPFTVTKNGKYTAPAGVAYSPVTVNVPSDGTIDFPYGLKEILPETELIFKFDESSIFPSTPTAVYADADATLNMLENNQIIESGDSGIVIWDGAFYAVYSGNRFSPPLLKLDGSPAAASNVGFKNSIGDAAIFSILKISKTATAYLQTANSAGGSDEPFFILADARQNTDLEFDENGNLIGAIAEGWGYIFASRESPDIIYRSTVAFSHKYADGFYLYTNGSYRGELTLGTTLYVEWDKIIYPLVLKQGTFEGTLVYYLGNGRILGASNTGEEFIFIFYPDTKKYSVGVYNPTKTPDENDFISYRIAVFSDKEIKHTVQIFKFEEKRLDGV